MTFPRSNIFIVYSNILLQNPTLYDGVCVCVCVCVNPTLYDDSHLKPQLINNFLFLANTYALEKNTLCSLHHW